MSKRPVAIRYKGNSRVGVDGVHYWPGAVIQQDEVSDPVFDYLAGRDDFEDIQPKTKKTKSLDPVAETQPINEKVEE